MNAAADAAQAPFTDRLKDTGRRIAAFFAVLGAAKRAAAASRSGRRPTAGDLRLLGISAEAFPRL